MIAVRRPRVDTHTFKVQRWRVEIHMVTKSEEGCLKLSPVANTRKKHGKTTNVCVFVMEDRSVPGSWLL